ncbi:triose-phosphate isomerase family protein [Mycobacterium sp.]|uniref:triose-phosphate isomerase family protein n=1 Tax=Mycobacterium sp. TaxID=1785 RepID=UPI002D912A04|nr:triose-phosphate isomerase family protein [Mycobacterium sp.]
MPSLFIGVSLKMYFGRFRTADWCRAVADIASTHPAVTDGHVRLVVLPSHPYLLEARSIFSATPVQIGGQDLFWEDGGAFTGEVSGTQLRELGCDYAEIGHAERRRIFGEDDAVIAAKTAAAFRNGLTPLVCVGEANRSSVDGAAAECGAQLTSALATAQDIAGPVVVAYEPQWAIGAAEPASPHHITAVCEALRAQLSRTPFTGSQIVYGGSAQPGLLTQLKFGVDGLFLGRFAHDPAAVATILDEAVGLAVDGRPQWRSA